MTYLPEPSHFLKLPDILIGAVLCSVCLKPALYTNTAYLLDIGVEFLDLKNRKLKLCEKHFNSYFAHTDATIVRMLKEHHDIHNDT